MRIRTDFIPVPIFLATALLGGSFVAAQTEKPEKQNSPATQPAAAGKPETKRVLVEATRVNTSEVAKTAARDASQKSEKPAADAAEPAVVEFQPAVQQESGSAPGAVTTSKDSKRSPLKNVHGAVHGTTGAGGNHSAGGAVGASSKSGKSSIYVETERSRSTTDPPR